MAFVIHDPAVLDHAAFRKDDDLAAAEYLFGKQREQARMIMGEYADVSQISGQYRVALKEFPRGDGAAVGAGFLIDQKLGDECFKAREMVE